MKFTRDILLQAIENINLNSSLKDNRNSSTYDLIFNNIKYPPILVLSEANKINGGGELFLSDFNNKIDAPFKILRDAGFEISKKTNEVNYWIEKTIVKNRPDRLEGERALGKVLWSPQKDKGGADIYKNMTKVKEGDYVLHLIDNLAISGVSKVKNKAIKTEGLDYTGWDGPAFLISLEKHTPFKNPLSRTTILNSSNKKKLDDISNTSEVFYNKKLDLRQGAYLTPCPLLLLELLNNEYYNQNSENIPLINLAFEIETESHMNNFNYKSFHQKTEEAGLLFSEKMVARFVASLCTKPFVICSGLSGSGKTKLAQAFVQWICESEEQYKIIPVGADWTNREPLLGYPNGLEESKYVFPDSGALQLIFEALKPENENKPYFLILDEMNLSHVERYFADFLSIMESKGKIKLYSGTNRGIAEDFEWPKNLFIIGTVNIDETTYMFSPKVLDRANVIEFRISSEDLEQYLNSDKVLNMDEFLDKSKTIGLGANMGKTFLSLANGVSKHTIDNQTILLNFFKELQKAGAEFGYRSTFEINRLIAILNELSKDDKSWDGNKINTDEFIDIAIMQKLLPKLHGSRNKLTRVLPILGSFCVNEEKRGKIKEYYFDKIDEIEFKDDASIIYKLSFEKICRMYKNAIENGYASYAEA
jgi:hypothetical protein